MSRLKSQVLCGSLDLEARRRLPQAGVLMRSGEIAATVRGRNTLAISSGKDKSCNFALSTSGLPRTDVPEEDWSRGDIFKFASTTHLDVRHFSVAKENHQMKQPTFSLSFVKE